MIWISEERLLFRCKTVCESLQIADMQEQTARKVLLLKYRRAGDKGGSPSGSAANARSRALLSFALFRLPIWRVLERRGAAEPLVYSSTRHSATNSFLHI